MTGSPWLERPHVGLVDDTAQRFSIGEEFARAVRADAPHGELKVMYRAHLTSAFPLFAHRPRYTVRDLVKTASTADGPVEYIRERVLVGAGTANRSRRYENTREAGAVAMAESAAMTDIEVDVAVPVDLLSHSGQLAQFVDYRVLVRLSVRENETLLHGSPDQAVTGLLNEPGVRRHDPMRGPVEDIVFDLAAEVEEAGGSLDGMVVHPQQYWQLVRAGVLPRLEAVGVKVSRTRMIPAGQLLLGDFSAAATLFLPRVGSLELLPADDPGQRIIRARTRFGFAVGLPDHLITLEVG
ncbi:family 3 encapsulin nanocompartment shell protein [Nocardia sp. NPDC004340]